ncbi:hypothetical protein FOCC_FOCC015190 [Frankliniella occidentalis]|nr:hypothetical protein FOCC_FOCC015190 [Frankliniella occidentalis]
MARALCRDLVVAVLIASCLGKTADELAKEATADFKDMKIVFLENKGTNTSYEVGNEGHLLQNRDFIKSKQTVLYIHGALQSPSDVSSQTVTNALDPAGAKAPFLGFPHLVREDALFVDVIHTDAGTTFGTSGYDGDCGHIDFWPNNGRAIQPGCENVKGR